jgi:uridine kinase
MSGQTFSGLVKTVELHRGVLVVGISGLSGSGKSTLAKKLAARFPDRSCVLNVDDFCTVPTRHRKSYLQAAIAAQDIKRLEYLAEPDNPAENPYASPLSWYDWTAAAEVIERLRAGHSTERIGAWNQSTGECDRIVSYAPPETLNALYLVDCIYLFEPPLDRQIDFHVMIDVDPAAAALREDGRDSHRSDSMYLYYKKIVSRIYCRPYLEKYRHRMNVVLQEVPQE